MAGNPTTSRDLQGLIDEFCAVRRGEWTTASRHKHDRDLKRFVRWLRENDLPVTVASLDTTTMQRYKDDLVERPAMRDGWRGRGGSVTPERRTDDPRERMSLNTVRSYLSPVRTFCTWLVREEELERNPFSPGKRQVRLKTVDGPLKAATREELSFLEAGTRGTAALQVRDRAIFSLLRWTGVRAKELCGLRVEDVDTGTGILRVLEAKGDKPREIPLPDEAVPDLLRYLRRGRPRLLAGHRVRGFEDLQRPDPGWFFLSRRNGRGPGRRKMTPNTIGQVLGDAHRRGGGVGPSGPHGLRHFRAAELVAGGMPIATLMRILGHENITTTQRYLRSLGVDDLKEATRRADGANRNRRVA